VALKLIVIQDKPNVVRFLALRRASNGCYPRFEALARFIEVVVVRNHAYHNGLHAGYRAPHGPIGRTPRGFLQT